MGVLKTVLVLLRAMLIPKVHLAVENFALRQQLAVCTVGTRRDNLDHKPTQGRGPIHLEVCEVDCNPSPVSVC